MLIRQFEAVAESAAFGRLPPPKLAEALACDSLCVGSEESVFSACAKWFQARPLGEYLGEYLGSEESVFSACAKWFQAKTLGEYLGEYPRCKSRGRRPPNGLSYSAAYAFTRWTSPTCVPTWRATRY